jgi:hypothetical protein
MNPKFLAIGHLIVNAVHIVSVDLRSPGTAHIQLSSGNVYTFVADEAAAVAAFFKAIDSAGTEPGTLPDGRGSDGSSPA